MPTIKRFAPWMRAVLVLAAVGLIVGRATFAALQSQQAVLAGNTIESATAALQLSTDGATYVSSVQGFTFAGLIPGGPAMPSQYGGKPLWFKNNGNATLAVKAMISTAPNITGDVDLTKVFVVLNPASGGAAQTISLAALQSAATNGGVTLTMPVITPGTQVQYNIQVSMAADAFTGNSATIQNLNIVFVGGAYVSS
jgi:hypothetical protein